MNESLELISVIKMNIYTYCEAMLIFNASDL